MRLLYTDEIAVQDREECAQYLPPTLEWLFSWVPGNRETAGPPAAEAESYRPFPEAPPEYWLYFGLKAGSSLRFYYRPADKVFVEDDVAHFFNVSAGLHLSFYFLSFLGVQAEALFTSDYAPYKAIDLEGTGQSSALRVYHDAQFISQSLMFPLTLHFTLRKTSFFASALGGVYLIVPLGEMRNRYFGGNFAWSVDPPLGYTAGINLGTKAGPGNLFLDLRWSQDLALSRKNSGETIYRRSAVSIAVGYELGFFRKHR